MSDVTGLRHRARFDEEDSGRIKSLLSTVGLGKETLLRHNDACLRSYTHELRGLAQIEEGFENGDLTVWDCEERALYKYFASDVDVCSVKIDRKSVV